MIPVSIILPPTKTAKATLEGDWRDITPGISTWRDIQTFADNPNFFNAAMAFWGGASDAALASGLLAPAGLIMKSGSAALKGMAKKYATKEVRRGALRRQQNAINRELTTFNYSNKLVGLLVKNAYLSGIALEGVLQITLPIFDNMPPLWKQYRELTLK